MQCISLNENEVFMKEKYFEVGTKVIYTPSWVNGDLSHPSCKSGVVTSINNRYIFIKYGNEIHSKATYRSDLTISNVV